ncbi:vesicle transport protein GOT1-like isoform X1 [Euphorbia lathyris]|uniref:vesicle transport protein GOT1-like isoform X1 n=1 Tax=Euphorbia lathyris TaxID=212925 RepID=UPI003313C99E
MVSFEMNDRKKIGLGLTGFGVFFSFLGVIFFFDKGLLAMGNILFLSGVSLTIGLKSTLQFFMKRQNFKGSISFGVGFFLIVIGWPIIGMILEAYGFIILFSGFWPTLSVFVQKIPILGWIFQQPFLRSRQCSEFLFESACNVPCWSCFFLQHRLLLLLSPSVCVSFQISMVFAVLGFTGCFPTYS